MELKLLKETVDRLMKADTPLYAVNLLLNEVERLHRGGPDSVYFIDATGYKYKRKCQYITSYIAKNDRPPNNVEYAILRKNFSVPDGATPLERRSFEFAGRDKEDNLPIYQEK